MGDRPQTPQGQKPLTMERIGFAPLQTARNRAQSFRN